VRAYEDVLLGLRPGTHADLLNEIGKTKDLSDANAAKLKDVVTNYTKSFA
jgi:F-type H+-transporting ATPase subunit alpha